MLKINSLRLIFLPNAKESLFEEIEKERGGPVTSNTRLYIAGQIAGIQKRLMLMGGIGTAGVALNAYVFRENFAMAASMSAFICVGYALKISSEAMVLRLDVRRSLGLSRNN